MIDRRTVSLGILAGAGLPLQADAQTRPPGKIGYLHPVTIASKHVTYRILQQTWQRLGYIDNRDVIARSAEGNPDKLPDLVSALADVGVGVLLPVGAAAVRAAASHTKTIPIVAIDMETDPVQSGLIASYGRPGGNVTGLFLDLPEIAAKWIELLLEAAPGIKRIAFAWQPSTGTAQLEVALAAARAMNLQTAVVETGPSDDYDAKFASIADATPTGIVQLTFPGLVTSAPQFSEAATRRGMPTITFLRSAAEGGLFLSFGPDQHAYFPRAVELADQILRGAKAGELPIERPTKFELVVNMRTGKSLGLTLPPSILLRADAVIE